MYKWKKVSKVSIVTHHHQKACNVEWQSIDFCNGKLLLFTFDCLLIFNCIYLFITFSAILLCSYAQDFN